MGAQRPRGGGISLATPPGMGNVASQLAETQDVPVTPKPTRWRSGNAMQPVPNDSRTESVSMDENEGQEHWQPGGSSRTPSRTLIGRLKHQTSLLDASKQAQVLVGALEAAQTQQQETYQMVLDQVQAHLAEELFNWRAEQQIQEGIADHKAGTGMRQDTPATNAQLSQTNQHNNNQTPKAREMTSQKSRQKPTLADLAALLSTKPGGQKWQEVTKKKQKNRQIQAVAVASQPDPTRLKPAKYCPKEARRLLLKESSTSVHGY
ncbi:hypothetical protein SI65_09979 [Aspergillus cristatus]|uniref:Uncharacterized protein n=1 Tax=Aspergillus cristatus TaxID=573508 RepID=A0A1E3B129_ASPCR|nr:hypothetical protein SI65_09979 [Aspergillus cristatus]